MAKIVHVDLKGAPFLATPRGHFWDDFCRLISKWGVNGILVEWEDSVQIPTLAQDRREFAYSRDEALWIVATAKQNNLMVIPLIQTFGHLEFVLKSESRKHLREIPDFPNCLEAIESDNCDAFRLVTSLIDDIVALTPDCPAIHLGGDEVWHLGTGPKSLTRLQSNPGLSRDILYVEHMSLVVKYTRQKYPDKRIMFWDDMLRGIVDEDSLKCVSTFLAQFAEPVVWNYSPDPGQQLNDLLWMKYSQLFPSMWIASAFKGASTSCAQVPPIMFHVSNQLGWLKLLEDKKEIIPKTLSGVILTGWQRFDHFASLCELLPVGIPSLCCCLASLADRAFGDEELERCSIELGIDLRAEISGIDARLANPEIRPKFPASEIYFQMKRFTVLQTAYNTFARSDVLITWFSDHNLRRGRFSPLQVQCAQNNFRNFLRDFRELESALRSSLSSIYPVPVCQEWLGTYLEPVINDITKNLEKAALVLEAKNFP